MDNRGGVMLRYVSRLLMLCEKVKQTVFLEEENKATT